MLNARFAKIIISWILSILFLLAAAISVQANDEAVLPITLTAHKASSQETREIITIAAEPGSEDMKEGKNMTLILPPGFLKKTSYLHAKAKQDTSSWIIGMEERATLINDYERTHTWIVEDLSTGTKTDQIEFQITERNEVPNTGDANNHFGTLILTSAVSLIASCILLFLRSKNA